MIKLNINFDPDDIPPNKANYDQDVTDSLQEIAALVPNHKTESFIRRLWGYFKQTIWEQQGHKCAFCEKLIVSSDDSQLEHFRPKSETRDEFNKPITRDAYWWLAYEHKNYIVSCFTCNNLKGNRFPIKDEGTRVKATNMNGIVALTGRGALGDEIPYIINPRYQDTEPHLAYNYRPDIKMVYIEPKNDEGIGEKTIDILDLNRIRKNVKITKDYLPYKRGSNLSDFINEIENYKQSKTKLNLHRSALVSVPDNVQLGKLIDDEETVVGKIRDNIKERFLSKTAEFSGMCLFWLKHYTELENDFIDEAA